MTENVIVKRYKYEEKNLKDFEAMPIRTYEFSALLDISDSPAFTKKEKDYLNRRIVVSIKTIKNPDVLRSVKGGKLPSYSPNAVKNAERNDGGQS